MGAQTTSIIAVERAMPADTLQERNMVDQTGRQTHIILPL